MKVIKVREDWQYNIDMKCPKCQNEMTIQIYGRMWESHHKKCLLSDAKKYWEYRAALTECDACGHYEGWLENDCCCEEIDFLGTWYAERDKLFDEFENKYGQDAHIFEKLFSAELGDLEKAGRDGRFYDTLKKYRQKYIPDSFEELLGEDETGEYEEEDYENATN
jgi:hypothetical protein